MKVKIKKLVDLMLLLQASLINAQETLAETPLDEDALSSIGEDIGYVEQSAYNIRKLLENAPKRSA